MPPKYFKCYRVRAFRNIATCLKILVDEFHIAKVFHDFSTRLIDLAAMLHEHAK